MNVRAAIYAGVAVAIVVFATLAISRCTEREIVVERDELGGRVLASQFPTAAIPTFIDLRQYGVVTDCPTCNVANHAAIKAAITANHTGPVNLHFPKGKIYVEMDAATNPSGYHSGITLSGSSTHDIVISGEGMFATTIVFQGVGDAAAFGDTLEIGNGAYNIEVRNMGFVHGTFTTTPDPNKWHGVHITNANSATSTRDVYIHDIFVGATIGDAIRVLGNGNSPTALVENLRVLNFLIHCGGHPQAPLNGARSGIAIQRGYRNIEFGNFYIDGPKNSPIDMEPSGAVIQDHFFIHDGVVDNSISTTWSAFSIAGTDSSTMVTNGVVRDVIVKEGMVNVNYADHLDIDHLQIIDTSAGPPSTGFSGQLLFFNHLSKHVTLRNVEITKSTGSDTGSLILTSSGSSSDLITDLRILGGTFIQQTDQIPLDMSNTDHLTIDGAELRYEASTPTSMRGIKLRSDFTDLTHQQIRGVRIRSPNGKLISGIWIAPASSNISDVSITGVLANGCCTQGVMFDASAGGAFVDPSPILVGNDFTGCTRAWNTDHASVGTVFPIIAGNDGPQATKTSEGTVAPESVVTGVQGDLYIWQNGDSSITYRKASGTGATGWRQQRNDRSEVVSTGAVTPNIATTYLTTSGTKAYTLANGDATLDGYVHNFVVTSSVSTPAGTLTPTAMFDGTTHTITWGNCTATAPCRWSLMWDNANTTWRLIAPLGSGATLN